MDLRPVNSINNDSNTIRVSDGNSPIRLIFKDVKGKVINLYDKIDYFYLTKDDDKFYSVTDISYEGDEVIIRLPKLRKGKYKAEIRDKDGSIYPANEDLYILLRRSFEDDKDIHYFGHREDILNSVEPIIIQHIKQNPDKFRGERGLQGFPGRDGLRGRDGEKGDKGDKGDKGIDISNAEVIQARGDENLLKNRLDKTDSQLADKVNQDVYNEFKGVTEVTFMAIDAKMEGKEPPNPQKIVNLWDLDNTVLGTLNENNGNLNAHALNRTTDFIPIESDVDYSFYRESAGQFKLVWFDDSKNYVDGEGWSRYQTHHIFKSPNEAKYLRLTGAVGSTEDPESIGMIINIGNVLVTDLDEDTMWDGGFWEFIPTPPLKEGNVNTKHIADGSVTEDKLSNDVKRKINSVTTGKIEPYPDKLNFIELSTGWVELNHLSTDGVVSYYKQGALVRQSIDDGETFVSIATMRDFNRDITSIQAVRDTGDGELLVSTTRNENNNLKSKVFKSVGYDRNNPENTDFVEVLEAISTQANIYEPWGLDVHDNIVITGEYGLRGENGARHVWLSTDYGNTFNLIFDQKTTTEEIVGAPTWTTSGHVHTASYDRFWERIWVVVGDRPNSATYYSDDWGQTWVYVNNDIDLQYTGIVAFKEGVIFGSDRGHNGLYVWYRTENKTDDVSIVPLKIINDDPTITHIFQRPFRRWEKKEELVLFPATRASSSTLDQGSVIMGFTGVDNPHILYELDGDNINKSGFINCVGVTARGNILTSYHNGTNHSILRAKAPVWE